MTQDCEGQGTTTMIAAMNVLDGRVISRNMKRYRHQELIRCLNVIESEVLVGNTIPAIVYNYAAHEYPNVRRWLERYPRWTFHFTPTSGAWLSAVEGSSATRRRLNQPRSTASSKSTIGDPSHSLGLPIATKSLPLSGTSIH